MTSDASPQRDDVMMKGGSLGEGIDAAKRTHWWEGLYATSDGVRSIHDQGCVVGRKNRLWRRTLEGGKDSTRHRTRHGQVMMKDAS